MDPTTVVIVLAIHLISTGVLLHLIGRQMPARSGLLWWSIGATVFGLAYLGRLASGLGAAPERETWALPLDLAMLSAGLMFLGGIREFVGAGEARLRQALGPLAVFLLLHLVVVALWGGRGRHMLLNGALGSLYLGMAVVALRATGAQVEPLRAPLRLLAGLMGGLGLLTLLRGAYIGAAGTQVLYQGLHAKVYYLYASLAAVLLGMTLLWMVFVRLNRRFADLAARDPLTQLLNRSGLQDVIGRHFAGRDPRPVILLQIDLDHFKAVNDQHGHAIGDRLLAAVAEALTGCVRGSDVVARVGGEEFLVACIDADPATAQALAERLRAAVREVRVDAPGRLPVRCTISVGVSRPCAVREGFDLAWGEADQALYAAKAAGRDQVRDFGSAPEVESARVVVAA